jgi:hypothetical protein
VSPGRVSATCRSMRACNASEVNGRRPDPSAATVSGVVSTVLGQVGCERERVMVDSRRHIGQYDEGVDASQKADLVEP